MSFASSSRSDLPKHPMPSFARDRPLSRRKGANVIMLQIDVIMLQIESIEEEPMKDRENKERVISLSCTPGLLRDIEELAEPQGGAQGCDGPPIEAKPGYVRCELAFPIRSYQ